MALTPQASSHVGAPAASVAQRAKNALRRLALDKLEPTPENYAIAYRLESGGARPPAVPTEALALVQKLALRAMGDDAEARAANFCRALSDAQWARADALLGEGQDGHQLAALIDRVVRSMERGGRQWTMARKKDSLQRVLDGSRSDARRLQQRLGQLISHWESDTPGEAVEVEQPGGTESVSAPPPRRIGRPGWRPAGRRSREPAGVDARTPAGPGGANAQDRLERSGPAPGVDAGRGASASGGLGPAGGPAGQ